MTLLQQTADAKLVRLSLSGDRTAFEEIVVRHLSPVSAVAYALTGDRSVSEDVTQEVFLTAWQRLKDLREPEKLRSWLCVITQNIAHTFGRRMARDPLRRADTLQVADTVPAPERSPADSAILAEQQRLVWAAIERIPESYRVPLVLFYREGQSVAQVASALELSDEAVRQRLSRARTMLKNDIAKLVEASIAGSQPGPVLVTAIMAGIASGTLNASAASATFVMAAKMGAGSGGSGMAAAASGTAVGAAIGPLVGFAGGFLGLLTFYRSGESPAERRLYLKFIIRIFTVSALCPVSMLMVNWGQGKGLLTPSTSVAVTVGAIAATFLMIGIQARRFSRRYQAVLLASPQPLTDVQARRLKSIHATREGWVSPDEVQARVERRPLLTGIAFHGGAAFPGLGWVMADSAYRNDTVLFYGALAAATIIEITAVFLTIRQPRDYLLHFSGKLFVVMALMGCTIAYWHFRGITNTFGASVAESWFLMRVLPVGLATGFLIGAFAMLRGHLQHMKIERQSLLS